MDFQPITKERLSEAAMQQIRQLISGQHLNPGQKLPSERELVQKLKISRASVREALRMLEIMGLVAVKPGKGAYIKELTSDLTIPLATWISTHKQALFSHLEVRLILEPAAAALAALRAGKKDIRSLKQTLAEFSTCLEQQDLVGLIQADIDFHRHIGIATQNETIQLFTNTITRLLVDSWKAALRVNGRPQKTVREHARILAAIEAGDQDQAQRAMQNHLQAGLKNLRQLGLENV